MSFETTSSNFDIGQSLGYFATNLPAGIGFDSASRTFSGMASSAGNFHVGVTALDSGCQQLGTNTTFNLLIQIVSPTLQIMRADADTIIVSWSPPSPGFVLQQNASLDPLGWTNAAGGGANPVTLPVIASSRFYRLQLGP
jgi:hypothetical protein